MSDKIICKYCKEEVDIDFEEHKDRKKRIILKGKCPSCNKTNVRYPKKEYPEVPSEEEPEVPSEPPSEEPPEVPSEGERVAEIVEGVVTSPQLQELITEEEEEEEDKDKKPLPIALIIAVSVILVLVIVSLWLFTQYLEYQKIKEEKHGDKEG